MASRAAISLFPRPSPSKRNTWRSRAVSSSTSSSSTNACARRLPVVSARAELGCSNTMPASAALSASHSSSELGSRVMIALAPAARAAPTHWASGASINATAPSMGGECSRNRTNAAASDGVARSPMTMTICAALSLTRWRRASRLAATAIARCSWSLTANFESRLRRAGEAAYSEIWIRFFIRLESRPSRFLHSNATDRCAHLPDRPGCQFQPRFRHRTTADEPGLDLAADGVRAQHVLDTIGIGDRLPFKFDQCVAEKQAGFLRRAARFYMNYEKPFFGS